MDTGKAEFGNIEYSKKVNNVSGAVFNQHQDGQTQEPGRENNLDRMHPGRLKRYRDEDEEDHGSVKRARRLAEGYSSRHFPSPEGSPVPRGRSPPVSGSNRAPAPSHMMLRNKVQEVHLHNPWLNMMIQRVVDGPLPRSMTDLQRMVEPGLFNVAGPEYSNHLNETLPPDDLNSQPSSRYLETTLEIPSRHAVNDVFRAPASPSTDASPSTETTSTRSGLPLRHLVVLDLNGSLLFRRKSRREVGSAGRIYPMIRRPYVGCLVKYLAHERTQSAVIVEHKPQKKVYHILPTDFDINWFNGISLGNKKKKKKQKRQSVDPRLTKLIQLRQKMKANSEKFTLMCALDAMVWSSVQVQNVTPMIDAVFGTDQMTLRACWSRKMLRLEESGYRNKVQTTKNLETIWWSSEDAYTTRSTILIDDTAKKARLQPWNLLQIPEYTRPERVDSGAVGWEKEDEEVKAADVDVTLLAVIGVLEELRNQSNIPAWIRGGRLLNAMHSSQLDMGVQVDEIGTRVDDETNGASAADDSEENLWCSDPDVLAYWVKRGKNALASRGIPVDVGLLNVGQDEIFKRLRVAVQ